MYAEYFRNDINACNIGAKVYIYMHMHSDY